MATTLGSDLFLGAVRPTDMTLAKGSPSASLNFPTTVLQTKISTQSPFLLFPASQAESTPTTLVSSQFSLTDISPNKFPACLISFYHLLLRIHELSRTCCSDFNCTITNVRQFSNSFINENGSLGRSRFVRSTLKMEPLDLFNWMRN